MEYLVRGQDVLFNLAGQVSHIDSMTDPMTDLEINCRSQLSILEAVRRGNPELKIVYAGTRQIYGRPRYLPVDEDHLARPHRRQRDQQDLGRDVPPRLPLGLRHSRLLPAPHQHLRPEAARATQPTGVHRLVHSSGDARRGDPDLRRREPATRLQSRRRRRRRASAGRRSGRRRRAGDEPRGRSTRVAPRSRRDPGPRRGARQLSDRAVSRGAQAHRHRGLLRRHHPGSRGARLGASGTTRRGLCGPRWSTTASTSESTL